jgi:hypothetical protein
VASGCVIYMTGVKGPSIVPRLDDGTLALLNTPKSAYTIADGWTWAADNGAFGKGYPGDDAWLLWLDSFTPEQRTRCLFAVAPDVVADHDATLARSLPWLPVIREMGYPAAFVLQDGATVDTVPWDEFAVAFVGGSTDWKLGQQARELIAAAQERGKRVHIGRVNSERRYRAFAALGVDSCDGTYLAFGPDKNLPNVLAWLRGHATQPALDWKD